MAIVNIGSQVNPYILQPRDKDILLIDEDLTCELKGNIHIRKKEEIDKFISSPLFCYSCYYINQYILTENPYFMQLTSYDYLEHKEQVRIKLKQEFLPQLEAFFVLKNKKIYHLLMSMYIYYNNSYILTDKQVYFVNLAHQRKKLPNSVKQELKN